MQKTIYIQIDTLIDNTVECTKLIKRGDTLILQIKVFSNGALADLTGQSIDLILKKADGTLIEKTIDKSNISNGVITVTLSQQATLAQGIVSGEVQIYTIDALSSTNTFTFNVDSSIADDVLEVSKDDIQVLADLRNLIANGLVTLEQYKNSILAIGNTVEAVQALANIKLYIDTNLPALESANAKATINIANEKTQNASAVTNIANLTTVNANATTLKTNLDADITKGNTLKTNLETDISTGNVLKTGLETDITNGTTLKTNLDKSISTGNTLKVDIDAENVRAEANITAMQGFGDVTQVTQNLTALKTEVETAKNGEKSLDARLDKNDVLVAEHSASLSERVQKTTADITYYVSTTGNDSNDGLTSGTAFKTIGKAVELIPQVVNHNVTINVAMGTYIETVSICGFSGKGFIKITGASALSDIYIVQNFIINYNCCRVLVSGFKCNNPSADAVSVTSCISVELFYIKSDVSAVSYNGIIISNSFAKVFNCNISNRLYALYAVQLSVIVSRDWSAGTGNTYGLTSNFASTIGKSGIQPQGTTAEYALNGGVIR